MATVTIPHSSSQSAILCRSSVKHSKVSHRFLVPIWRYSHVMRSVANIDSCRVGMHHIQAHHLVVALLLCSAHLHSFSQTTSASPAASGLEFFSTGSEPPCKRSHVSRSHALNRARRHHERHGFSCCSTSSPASQLLRSTASFSSWRRSVQDRPTLSRNFHLTAGGLAPYN